MSLSIWRHTLWLPRSDISRRENLRRQNNGSWIALDLPRATHHQTALGSDGGRRSRSAWSEAGAQKQADLPAGEATDRSAGFPRRESEDAHRGTRPTRTK